MVVSSIEIQPFKTVAYSGEGYRYYDFVDAESEKDFDTYILKCKELALYDTGVTAAYGDKLITLSTCEYSAPNGRFVVVAKRLYPRSLSFLLPHLWS